MPEVATSRQALSANSAVTPTYNNADSDGHLIPNNGKMWLHVVNDDASPTTVTVETTKTINGLAVADLAVTVPAGEQRTIGPFNKDTFDNGDGEVKVTFSNVTSVTFAVLALP